MFVLSLSAFSENTQRSEYRHTCRSVGATPEGYDVLTNPSNMSAEAVFRTKAALGFPPEECGWTGLPIRRFNASRVNKIYQVADDPYMLYSSLGGCQEYRDCDTSIAPGCDKAILPQGFFDPALNQGLSGNPLLVEVPDSKYCFTGHDDDTTALVASLSACLSLLVFLLYLVHMRYLSRHYAIIDDQEQTTTADFALHIENLDTSIPPDELKTRLKQEIEALSFEGTASYFKGRVHHVEASRSCSKELEVSTQLADLALEADELQCKLQRKEAMGSKVDKEKKALKALVPKFTELRETLRLLVEEPDVSTGHAFVVFERESDRNRFYHLFNPKDGSARPVLSVTSPEMMREADFEPPQQGIVMRGAESVLGLEPVAHTLVVKQAAEPREVNWTGMERSVQHERYATLVGYGVFVVLTLVATISVLAVKSAQAILTPELDAFDYMMEQVISLAFTAAVSGTTVVYATVFKLVTAKLVAWEGKDTTTEEEASKFTKLSFFLPFNYVFVYLLTTAILCNGAFFDQTTYEPEGLLATVAFLIVCFYSTDFLVLFNMFAILSKHILSRFVYSPRSLRKLWAPERMEIGQIHADTIIMFTLGLVFGPVYPISYLLVAIGLAFKWLCTRFGLRHWWSMPPSVDQKMTMAMRYRIGNAMGVGFVVQCLGMVSASGPSVGVDMPFFIFGSIALGLYTFVPFTYFGKSMALFDRLEESDATDDGPTFSEVSKTSPIKCPQYICPTLVTDSPAAGSKQPPPRIRKGLIQTSIDMLETVTRLDLDRDGTIGGVPLRSDQIIIDSKPATLPEDLSRVRIGDDAYTVMTAEDSARRTAGILDEYDTEDPVDASESTGRKPWPFR
jgi:hypothetical protein